MTRFDAPIGFLPILQPRVWGGRKFAGTLGRTLPADGVFGESWEIVDRPEACSVVASGVWAGRTLRELIAGHAGELMGPAYAPGRPFPLLVKWLDCRERLSLQVHPPAAVAPALGGEPKTEMWYVADAEPDAAVLAGFAGEVAPEDFRAALENGTAEKLVVRHPMAKGDSLFVPSGRIHAIDGGNLILEIQQNSDTTYRVYDWGRKGLDGKPRELHIGESMRSIDFTDRAAKPLRAAGLSRLGGVLADCPEFRVRRWSVARDDAPTVSPGGAGPRLLHAAEGGLELLNEAGKSFPVGQGGTVLLPHAEGFAIRPQSDSTFLISDRFAD